MFGLSSLLYTATVMNICAQHDKHCTELDSYLINTAKIQNKLAHRTVIISKDFNYPKRRYSKLNPTGSNLTGGYQNKQIHNMKLQTDSNSIR